MSHMDATYFQKLNQALQQQGRAIPFLLVDLDILDRNIDTLQSQLKPGQRIRLVVKSLPSPELLKYLMARLDTTALMVFHQPFLSQLTSLLDDRVDILLGKPMPVKTAAYYYQEAGTTVLGFDPFRQVQWLIDTIERLEEYSQLASHLGKRLRVNLEIDVGLHRGGFDNLEKLSAALTFIRQHPEQLQWEGFMGYDPHVAKLPSWLRSTEKALAKSNAFYRSCIGLVKNDFESLWHDQLTLNGAGSPTFGLHQNADSPLNEVALGSALMKPTTFDIASLRDFAPACWIATPVLKKSKGTRLPGLGLLPPFLYRFFPSLKESYFIYGGYWKADYCYPPDIKLNSLFGASTNQSMLNASGTFPLAIDDYIFLRPWQSEFVFLQFGPILTVRGKAIVGEWPIFDAG